MEIQPILRFAEPEYPNRSIVDEHPELLALVPERWRGNRAVLAALAGVCIIMPELGKAAAKEPATPISRVAPVFQRGDGHCVPGTMSSPVFLPEDEARQVITEEAKRAGIEFRSSSQMLPEIEMTSKNRREKEYKLILRNELVLDGVDKKRKISYEYVSGDDLMKWLTQAQAEKTSPPWWGNTRKASESLRSGLETAKPKGTYAVFYDPVAGQQGFTGDDQEQRNKQAEEIKAKSKELLREQVRDFIKWLKAQDII